MAIFKTEILNLLNDIKGGGSFVSHHVAAFQFPGLIVDKVGEISYPINEAQAKRKPHFKGKCKCGIKTWHCCSKLA